jgi:hypothetical protein
LRCRDQQPTEGLFTRRVKRMRRKSWLHLLLFRRFGTIRQTANCRI